jgi:hypothetical protein
MESDSFGPEPFAEPRRLTTGPLNPESRQREVTNALIRGIGISHVGPPEPDTPPPPFQASPMAPSKTVRLVEQAGRDGARHDD